MSENILLKPLKTIKTTLEIRPKQAIRNQHERSGQENIKRSENINRKFAKSISSKIRSDQNNPFSNQATRTTPRSVRNPHAAIQ